MNNMIWDAVLWLRKKLNRDKEDIITAVNNIQNLFETSADATASPSDILAGKTAYNGTVLLTGSMKDRRGMTVTSGTVTQDDEYTYLTVPEEACFNASSKLRTKNSNLYTIKEKVLATQSIAPGGHFDVTIPKGTTAVRVTAQNSACSGCLLFLSNGATELYGYRAPLEKTSNTIVRLTPVNDQYATTLTYTFKCVYMDV